MRSSIIHLLFTLIFAHLTLANPVRFAPKSTTTKPASAPTSQPLRDCSIFIQRWYHNAFDIYFYDVHWTTTVHRGSRFVQEISPAVNGERIFERQMGSKKAIITNIENPTSPTDNGKVNISWGSYSGNSWQPGSGCVVNYAQKFERATYLCNFQCDIDYPKSLS